MSSEIRLRVLDAENLARLDEAARSILERTGIELPHEEALRLFADAGAVVDHPARRVRIPAKMVDDSLRVAGKRFTVYGRDRSRRAEFGVGKRNYNSIAGEAHWLEPSGRRRFATAEDVRTAATLSDALPGITIAGAMADPHDIPAASRCVEVAALLLESTTKPVTFWFHDRKSAALVMELFAAVCGSPEDLRDYPPSYAFLEPISPLRFPRDGVDLLFETAKAPLPVSIGPMAQSGLSAPVTLAGTLAQETAEILAGICLVQLIRPGTPVCFGGIPHAFDMRTTQMIFAGPEQAIMAVAMTEMGKHYGLPVYINVGLTDSKRVDAQAGLEIGATLLMGALAGADIFGHLGIAGVDQAASPEMLIFQHEVIGYVERVCRSFQVDGETLALDEINAAGPGGMFIAGEHTLRHFRTETWYPEILDRSYWDQWERGGRLDTETRVRDRLNTLLRERDIHPLPGETAREFGRILAAARKQVE